MDITRIQYSFQSYKTTNPPISESRELTVSKTETPFGAPRFTLYAAGTFNSDSFQKELELTAEQFDALLRLFNSLHIKEDVLAALEQPAPPVLLPMTGGSESETLSFTANRITVTAQAMPRAAAAFVKEVRALLAALNGNDPFVCCAAPGACAPVQFVSPQPAAAAPGAWICPACKTPNSGSFCVECGSKRV